MQHTMQASLTLLSLVALASASDPVATASFVQAKAKVTPVQKVIQLMEGMMAKGKKEKHEEQVEYAAFKQWCDDTQRQKQTAIEEANEKIEVLKADIQKFTTDAEMMAKEIAEHEEDISVWKGDMKAATLVREIEKKDYDAAHKDYSESIDALGRALAVLKKQSADVKQAAFTQLSALADDDLIPDDAKRVIGAFLQHTHKDPSGMDVSAPEANAYEFQSQGIVDMLNDLLKKFSDELYTLEKEETETKNAYEMLMSDLESQVDNAEARKDELKAKKAETLEKKGTAEGELEDTTTTRDDDTKVLDDTVAECDEKSAEFEANQQLRAEELEAIQKAIEIISSQSVSGAAKKHLPGLIQGKGGAALAQLRSGSQSPAQHEVAVYLKNQAQQLNSRILAVLAVRVENDPFKKVKKMIKDLIDKLMEEANAEAEQKGWCDKELATNEHTRKEKTEAVETLKATIDDLTASISLLTEEVTELSEAVADIDAAVAKATKMREEEKAKNSATLKDAQEAQTAVQQALTVLKEFYAKAAKGATAVAAEAKAANPSSEVPYAWLGSALLQVAEDAPYKGMGGQAGGVVGMLEVIESDFAKLQAETSAAEAKAQKEYDEFMQDSEVDKTQKTKDIEHKTQTKQNQGEALVEAKKDLEGTQKELDAALAYYDKLKPSCVDAGVSYEDRVARRKEEIESLQEALKILSGAAI